MSELRQRNVIKSSNNDNKNHNRNHGESVSNSVKQNKEENKQSTSSSSPPKWKVWILASRPHTLTASIVPVMVSSSLIHHYNFHNNNDMQGNESESYHDNYHYHLHYISFLFGTFACLIQLGTNLYNDYSDFIKGADTDLRVGQARATQKGWLTPMETLYGSSGCLGLATCIGLYLTYICSTSSSVTSSTSTSVSSSIDYYMIFVTISSVFNAFCYTGGEYPLGYLGMGHLSIGYSGLGDLFVFLYFGIVATITVPYIYLRTFALELVQSQDEDSNTNDTTDVIVWKSELMYICAYVSLPIGFLATNIIVVNNLRDRHTDVAVGKNTMAVRFGEWFSRVEYILLMIGSYMLLVPLSDVLMNGSDSTTSRSWKNKVWVYMPLLSIPLAVKEFKAVGLGGKDGSALNTHVGGAAKVQLMFCLLLIAGLYFSHIM